MTDQPAAQVAHTPETDALSARAHRVGLGIAELWAHARSLERRLARIGAVEQAKLAEAQLRAEIDRLRAALEWYGEQAEALARYSLAKPPQTDGMMGVVAALSLDAGQRAKAKP